MNWFILELPNKNSSDIYFTENIKNKIREIEFIINNLKNLLTPH